MTRQTPFGCSLAVQLDVERQRFINDWICRWHQINVEGRIVDVDNFRGGRIQVGGGGFEGQRQQIYWEAIVLYLRAKVHEVLKAWDTDTESYPPAKRTSSLRETEGQLLSFTGQIIGKARETDRRLRGRGFPDQLAFYDPVRESTLVKTEIAHIVAAHASLLNDPISADGTDRFGIFVGYRRADTEDVAGRVYDRLEAEFGRSGVFKDVDSIPFGIQFRDHIAAVIGGCRVVLVLIGRRWLSASNADGTRRIDDPDDLVRVEVETALSLPNVTVMPVLINGATMPTEAELPASLHPLCGLNAPVVRPDPDFRRDMDRLVEAIRHRHQMAPHPIGREA